MNNFSGALRLTDLNDFIGPSQDCIKPVPITKSNKRGVIKLEDDGSLTQHSIPLQKQTISLTDCLACSGCVTSAETVLIESQSVATLITAMGDLRHTHVFVATASPQSVSSFAYRLGLTFEAGCRTLIRRLRAAGFAYVFSSVEGSEIAHHLGARELIDRIGGGTTPVLASACPGWICYAEKTQGETLLPFISKIKSPQSIMGSLVKRAVSEWEKRDVARVYHVAVMPCYDKKLEASRPDFVSQEHGVPETDLVLSTSEAFEMWGQESGEETVDSVGRETFDSVCSRDHYPIKTLEGGGSGGFADRILHHVASVSNHTEPFQIAFSKLRNKDLLESKVTIQGREFSVAKAYGFRNIQNIIQKMKHKRCKYDFVEMMACPGGCLNGGGQIKLENSEQLESLNALYSTVSDSSSVESANKHEFSLEQFSTSYHAVEKSSSALSTLW